MLLRKQIKTDICVIGGGIAGICAAISAARCGSKVVLMHERPVLGGNASSEIRMWVCGAAGDNNRETGIIEEIMLENLYRNPTKNFYIWDSILYEFVMKEPNIQLLLNCTCMDAETEKGEYPHGRSIRIGKVTGYQMTTQTFFDISACSFIDCSGDSILAPLTGADFRVGRESKQEYNESLASEEADRKTMGMSCLVQGRETSQNIPFIAPEWVKKLSKEDFKNREPNIYRTDENFWYLELGGTRDSIHDTEEISKELVSLAAGTWDYVKNSGSFDADRWELEFMGFLPGKRESRRMLGQYTLTQNDIMEDRDFDDVIAYGGWPLDDHFPEGFYHKGVPNTNILPPSPYKIPYRTIYSANVDNLFFAGRNISVSHAALSSTRVMATCGLLGEAAGFAACLCCRYHISPHDVYLSRLRELQDLLMDHDCFLPGKSRRISEVCMKADCSYSDGQFRNGVDRPCEKLSASSVVSVKNGDSVIYSLGDAAAVEKVHITFDSDLNRLTTPGDACERKHGMRANILLNSPQMHLPATLCRDFELGYRDEKGQYQNIMKVTDSRTRYYDIPLGRKVKELVLKPLSNWGGTEYTPLFSFDFI